MTEVQTELTTLEKVLRSSAIVDEIGSDELPAKYDRARERNLPPAVAYYGDNKLFRESPDFINNRDETLRFIGDDPVRAAVFKSNDDRSRLDEIFRTGNLININETPQVRYGRVVSDIYDRPDGMTGHHQIELRAAGWEPDGIEKDLYHHRDGRRLYRPVLRSWLEGPQEKKINDDISQIVLGKEYDLAKKEYDDHLDTAKMLASIGPIQAGGAMVDPAAMYLENNVRVNPSEVHLVNNAEKTDRLQKLALYAVWMRQSEGEKWQDRLKEDGYFEARSAEFWRSTGVDPRGLNPEELAKLDISKTDPSKLFNFFGLLSLRESVQFRRDLDAYREGSMNRYERADFELRLWQKRYDELMGETFGKQVMETISSSIGEMGAFGIAHKPITAGGGWLFRKLGVDLATKSGLISKVAKTVGLVASEEAMRLPLYAPEIIANVMSEQDQSALRYNPETRQMVLDMTSDQQLTLGAMTLKYMTQRGIENVSERVGGAFDLGMWSKMFSSIPHSQVRKIGASVGNAMAQQIPIEKLRPLARQIKNIKDVTQFHGLIGEYLEEEFGKSAAFGLTKFGESFGINGLGALDVQQPFMTQEERLLTFVSVGSLCGVMNLPGGVARVSELRNKAQRLDLADQAYRLLHPKDGEKVPSRAVVEDLLDNAVAMKIAFGLDAGKFQALYQESPELQTALNFSDDELSLINTRVEENGVIEVPFARMAMIEQHELYRKVSDLALDTENGGILSENTMPVSPEVATEIEQRMAEEDQLAQTSHVVAEQQRRELDTELERLGTELSARFKKTQVQAQIALLGAMARNLGRATGKNPSDLLKGLAVSANSRYADFAQMVGAREEVPFQAAAALRRPGAPNSADQKGQLRDGNVPCPAGFMEWGGLQGTRLYADYEFLRGRHPQYFSSPEEARAAVELVLLKPEKVKDIKNNRSFVGFDEETGKIYRVEIDPVAKNKYNHIRSVFEISAEQYEKIKLDKVAAHLPEPTEGNSNRKVTTISSFLRYDNATEKDVKEQSAESRKKGAFDSVSGTIHLFEAADLSTFSHETMHYFYSYLEMLDADGMLEGTPLKQDLETIRTASLREDGSFDAEKLPKAFEYYLKTGKAPNAELQGVFSRFREWLTQIYRTVKGYFDANPLPDEIREVFDRWLASEEMATREMSSNEWIALQREFELLGMGGETRGAILPWAEKQKEKLFDTLESFRIRGRNEAMSAARKQAQKELVGLQVYQTRDFLRLHGKLDAVDVKAAFGAETLKTLRGKGVIAKRPRTARPGEKFHDPEQRRDKEIGRRQYAQAYDEYLYGQHYLVWLIRNNHYGKIRPDAKFGITIDRNGSFLDGKKGIPSDAAARELSELAGYEVSEQELVDALDDLTYGEIRKNFQSEYRSHKAYWDTEAENSLRLAGTASLDAVAAENGYESAAQMVEALADAPTEHEYVSAAAEQAAIRFDESFPASEAVVATDAALDWNDRFIQALASKANVERSRISRDALKGLARSRVSTLPFAAALRTDLRLKAIERNARDTARALKKEDWQGALDAARKMQLNSALLAVQQQLRDQALGVPRRVKNIVRKHARGDGRSKVAGDVFYYYRQLARDYGFSTDPRLDRVTPPEMSLSAILANSGMDDIAMESLPPVRNYRELTVAEFSKLHDFLGQLYGYALDLVKNADSGRKMAYEETKQALLANLKELPNRSNDTHSPVRSALSWTGNKLVNLLHQCRRLDNDVNVSGTNLGGLVERMLYDRISNQDTAQKVQIEEIMKALESPFAYFRNRFKEMPQELLNLPDFGDEVRDFADSRWTAHRALFAALNLGTAKNRERLMSGFGWDESALNQIAALFDRKADWENIQKIWDAIDTLYPDLNRVYRKVNFHTMERESAAAFAVSTADSGEINVKGGYYPISYDPRLKFGRGAALDIDNASRLVVAPPSGMTKERQAHTGMALDLSEDGLLRHIEDTTRYIAFKELSRELGSFLGDKAIEKNIVAKFGRGFYRNLRDNIVNAVNPDNQAMDELVRKAKGLMISASLWGNPSSAAIQLSTIMNGIESAGGLTMWTPVFAEFANNPAAMIRAVNELAPAMRERSRGRDRDIKQEIAKIYLSKWKLGWDKAKNYGFLPLNLLDRCAVYPMWMCSFRNAVNNGYAETEAAAIATKLVFDTQGSNRAMDTTPMQRVAAANFFLMFAGPTIAQSNRIYSVSRAAMQGKISVGNYLNAMLSSLAAPVFFTMLIQGVLQNNLDDFGSDDDDKRRKAWLKLGSESGSILLAGMPLGRDLPRLLFEGGIPRSPVTDLLRVGSDPWNAIFRKRDSDGDVMPSEVLYQIAKSVSVASGVPVLKTYERMKRIHDAWNKDSEK